MSDNMAQTDLAVHLIDKAERCLHAATVLLDTNELEGAANRAYYAVFNCMRAIHVLDKFGSKSHDTIISKFREKYIKTKIFPISYSVIIGDVMEMRTACDYQDYYMPLKEDTVSQVDNARVFLDGVKEYVFSRIKE